MANPLANLSARDRKILLWSIPVIALLALALLAKALLAERREAVAGLDRALEDLAWLQAQKDAMAQLNQGCVTSPWNDATVARLATRHGVVLAAPPAEGDGIRLAIAAGHGNQVIAFLNDLECQGARVEQLTLDTVDDAGAVQGEAVVLPPVM